MAFVSLEYPNFSGMAWLKVLFFNMFCILYVLTYALVRPIPCLHIISQIILNNTAPFKYRKLFVCVATIVMHSCQYVLQRSPNTGSPTGEIRKDPIRDRGWLWGDAGTRRGCTCVKFWTGHQRWNPFSCDECMECLITAWRPWFNVSSGRCCSSTEQLSLSWGIEDTT